MAGQLWVILVAIATVVADEASDPQGLLETASGKLLFVILKTFAY